MKGDGTSESSTSYSSESETTDSSSSTSFSSSPTSSGSGRCKRKRKHTTKSKSRHDYKGRRRCNDRDKSTSDKNRYIKLRKSGSSKEDTYKDKSKRHGSRRFAVKSESELTVSKEEERLQKQKRKEKEKREKSKLRKQKKRERKQQNERCNMEELHENECFAGKRHQENIAFQALTDAKEQQKAIIRRNADLAKARLASGELQRARSEQMKMQNLYGTVDWRAKKKLRTEKRMLERTVAAGKKLASLDERETARMDAFRVALGLPTAEAQRQAEWRAEATHSLAEISKSQELVRTASRHAKVIGPCLPRS
eukprot:Gb_32554 [translate_table: standard]